MKIATFNANSLRARLDIVTGWLTENQPDVLCIQETKVQDKDFPEEAFADTGYHYVFKGEKKYNGVAIFSKEKPADVAFGLDDEPKDEPRLAKAVVNGISVVNTYVPQGQSPDSEMFQYKLQWFSRLKSYFDSHFSSDDPVIWVGDLNAAMDERDVHDPDRLWGHVCYCREVQEAMQDIIDWGFTDIFRLHCDDGGQYTFWDYRAPYALRENIGWRLDYIMATNRLVNVSKRCWVDVEPRKADRPSDHTFLIAEFDI